jgi:tetratricopeptide (TPR) repeat protein
MALDQGNLEAALDASERIPDGAAAALQIMGATLRFWTMRDARFGVERCAGALARADDAIPYTVRARGQYAYGRFLAESGATNVSEVERAYRTSHDLYRAAGDRRGMADTLIALGMAAGDSGNFEAARQFFEDGLEINRELGLTEGISVVSHNLGVICWMQGDLQAALELMEEARALRQSSGDRSNAAIGATSVAMLSMRLGRAEAAMPALIEALEYHLRVGSRNAHTADALICAAEFLTARGAFEVAVLVHGAEEALLEAIHFQASDLFTNRRDETIDRVREALGESAYRAALERGRTLPLVDAIGLAIDSIRSSTA